MLICKGKRKRKKKVSGTDDVAVDVAQPLMWLNRSVATINAMLRLLDIYRYRYRCVVFQNKFS